MRLGRSGVRSVREERKATLATHIAVANRGDCHDRPVQCRHVLGLGCRAREGLYGRGVRPAVGSLSEPRPQLFI